MVPLFHASAKAQAWYCVLTFFTAILINRALSPIQYRRPSIASLIGSVIGLALGLSIGYAQHLKRKFRKS